MRHNLILKVSTVLLLAISIAGPALSNPTGPTLVSGSALISNPSASVMQVVNTPGTIINWNGFSIAGGETTRFVQLNALSAVLNRVTGGNPSSILGRLESNGRVFLVNPNGIVFGGSSVVDVVALIASTRDISDANFTNGNYVFSGGGIGNVTLQNGAQILTSGTGGQVWLIANQVNAEAGSRIDSPQGQVVLAAGSSVSVGTSNLGGMSFTVLPGAGNTVEALGEIVAQRGAVGFFADTVNLGNSVSARGGSVSVAATRDVVVNSGTSVDVSGSGNEKGGSISIEAGRTLQMHGTAELNADGGIAGDDGGSISLTAYDLRLPVAGLQQGVSLVHAFAAQSPSAHGTVSLNQTGTFSYAGTERDLFNGTTADPTIPRGVNIVPGLDGGFLAVFTSPENDSANRKIRVYAGDGTPRGSFTTHTMPGFSDTRSSGLSDGSYMVLWRDLGISSMQLIRADGTLNGGVVNLTTRGETIFDLQPLLSGGYAALGSAGTVKLYDNNGQLTRTINDAPSGNLLPMARGFAIVNTTAAPGYSVQRYDGTGNAIGGVTLYDQSDMAFPSTVPALTAPLGQQLHVDGHFSLPNFGVGSLLLTGQQFLASKFFSDPIQWRRFSITGLDPLGSAFTLPPLNGFSAYAATVALADGSFAQLTRLIDGNPNTGSVPTSLLASVRNGDGTQQSSETIHSGTTTLGTGAFVQYSNLRSAALGNGGFAVAVSEQHAVLAGGLAASSDYKPYIRTYEKTGGPAPVVGLASGGVGQSASFATRPGLATNTAVPPPAPPANPTPPTVVTGSGSGASFEGIAGCNAAVCSEAAKAMQFVNAARAAQLQNQTSESEALSRMAVEALVERQRHVSAMSHQDLVALEANEGNAILRDYGETERLLATMADELQDKVLWGSATPADVRRQVDRINEVMLEFLQRERTMQQMGLYRTDPKDMNLSRLVDSMSDAERVAFFRMWATKMQTDPNFGAPQQ